MSKPSSELSQQYADSSKLAARARLHTYSVSETPWFFWVARQLPLKSGDRVLEVGCGTGWFWAGRATEIMPSGLDITLTDQSPGMLDEAMNRCRSLPFGDFRGLTADASALPFEDGAFDAVIAMHMLYHLDDPAVGIAEMFRVLKPGGFLAVTTNGAGDLKAMYALATVLGHAPHNAVADVFGYDQAKRMMQEAFGNVTMTEYPAVFRITDPEDIFNALTSYPPGDRAGEPELAAFRGAIAEAFERGGGMLEARKETALFVSRKAE